ncbi:MAG: ATP synthase F1 subunit epsilon [Clostridia bacterium]|nr:ATP synthase F1 subunit epsilon [Clostridia bacterium]
MTYKLRIVTPEGIVFDDQVDKVVANTVTGEICILAKHINLVTVIDVGKVKVCQGEKIIYGACSGGLLTIKDGECSIVATTFECAEDIDVARAQAAKERAEEKLKSDEDAKRQEMYKAKLKRAICRLKVSSMANGSN